ncbi:MAG TPA: glycine zipper 2TM domain-containing protein [Burkholderiales bacterium]|jgi:outer membrane lipoprotein SlyB|nr:glycine zipper 2TM domain-containing protein [Burkholderiales bacterium]
METNTRRLHPLLTAAAISVTVLSAVGVASLTGLIPHSLGSQKQETAPQEQASVQVPAEIAKPVEPAIAHPASPKKAQVKRATPRPSAPVAYNDYGTPPPPPPYAQAPAQAVETPKPVAQPGNFATVQAVREVKDAGEGTALGPVAGGIAGAVLGNQIGKGHGSQKVITVLGAAGGAFAGHAIEKQARGTTHWEVDVHRDDGTNETVRSDVAPGYQPGQRVKLIDGKLQPA